MTEKQMPDGVDIVILGASARAAAFSALRAGLRPWCADLFADTDLRAICPSVRLAGPYPNGFAELLAAAPQVPWLYTGGLENHPRLVAQMARTRTLWGNDASALTASRAPANVDQLLRDASLPAPRLGRHPEQTSGTRRWLLKPRRGAGGAGIRFYTGMVNEPSLARSYLQEYIEGEARAAIFAAGPWGTRLLGMTLQLVGESWLNAVAFHYCGSIGPLPLTAGERLDLERIGTVLAAGCGLRGLFGVDGVWRDGVFWPVEVNPRYTASVEVLEYASGMTALTWHGRAFDSSIPEPPGPTGPGNIMVGKAILFARDAAIFPTHGPWRVLSACSMPEFADIPASGHRLEARRPVLTLFARAADVEGCRACLRRSASELDRLLFGKIRNG